jgi:hypothetical protein
MGLNRMQTFPLSPAVFIRASRAFKEIDRADQDKGVQITVLRCGAGLLF